MKLKAHQKLWTKIILLDHKLITQMMTIKMIKFNSDGDLPVNKTLELRTMIIVI